MKNIVAKFFVIAGCFAFSAHSLSAFSSTPSLPSLPSFAADETLAGKGNSISDEELFGNKVSYSTELSQSQASNAVGNGFWIPVAVGFGFVLSCVKIKEKTIYQNVCTGEGAQRRCEMRIVGKETEVGLDCPF